MADRKDYTLPNMFPDDPEGHPPSGLHRMQLTLSYGEMQLFVDGIREIVSQLPFLSYGQEKGLEAWLNYLDPNNPNPGAHLPKF